MIRQVAMVSACAGVVTGMRSKSRMRKWIRWFVQGIDLVSTARRHVNLKPFVSLLARQAIKQYLASQQKR